MLCFCPAYCINTPCCDSVSRDTLPAHVTRVTSCLSARYLTTVISLRGFLSDVNIGRASQSAQMQQPKVRVRGQRSGAGGCYWAYLTSSLQTKREATFPHWGVGRCSSSRSVNTITIALVRDRVNQKSKKCHQTIESPRSAARHPGEKVSWYVFITNFGQLWRLMTCSVSSFFTSRQFFMWRPRESHSGRNCKDNLHHRLFGGCLTIVAGRNGEPGGRSPWLPATTFSEWAGDLTCSHYEQKLREMHQHTADVSDKHEKRRVVVLDVLQTFNETGGWSSWLAVSTALFCLHRAAASRIQLTSCIDTLPSRERLGGVKSR